MIQTNKIKVLESKIIRILNVHVQAITTTTFSFDIMHRCSKNKLYIILISN